MGEHVIPDRLHLVAQRAALRTITAGYAAAIPTGVTAGSVLAVLDSLDTRTAVVTAAVAVLTPLGAGLRAYLRMLAGGIPAEYTPTLADGRTIDEANADLAAGGADRDAR